jgi:hypothetical protein
MGFCLLYDFVGSEIRLESYQKGLAKTLFTHGMMIF